MVGTQPATAPPRLEGEFRVRLEMLTDWHVGAGAGRHGDLDRLVARDPDGLPFVPAKTLTGVWRDACEQVAWALDGGTPGGWQAWVGVLFGDQPAHPEAPRPADRPPRPAALSLRPARMPESLRAAVAALPPGAREEILEAFTFVKPGVRIDPRSGRAMRKHLRFDEVARGGARLEAEGALELPASATPEHRLAATALLLAGAAFLERLGGGRRRGLGRCRLSIEGFEDVEPYLAWVEGRGEPPDPPEPPSEVPRPAREPPGVAPRTASPSGWWKVELRIVTETPLVLRRETLGNIVRSLDFIPGSLLLPILTRTLGARVDVPARVAEGSLVVTHATPEVGGARGRPVPRVLVHLKDSRGLGTDEGGPAWNLFEEDPPQEPWKDHRTGYVGETGGGGLPAFLEVPRHVTTHNVIDDVVQRPTLNAVYTYEGLPAGTALRAELRLRDRLKAELDAGNDAWWERLSGQHRMGTSKKDDYGLVRLEASEPEPVPLAAPPEGHRLRVWLLSDVLLRDERLRPVTSAAALAEELSERLGVRVGVPEAPKGNSWVRRTESWHARWGLPRPTLAGLGAGSCLGFEITAGKIDSAAFTDLLVAGVGERRAEGFGQVAINDPLLEGATSGLTRAPALGAGGVPPRSPVKGDDPAHAYARLVEREAWRAEIRTRAVARAAEDEWRDKVIGGDKADGRLLNPTKLGTIQDQALRVLAGEAGQVRTWVEQLPTGNEPRAWPKETKKRLSALLGRREVVWDLLDEEEDPLEDRCLTEDGPKALRDELWAEAVAAVLFAAVSEERAKGEGTVASAAGARPSAAGGGR